MPYLPQRRYRPAASRAGNFSPRGSAAQRPGFQDQTMPKWLRDALAKAQGVTPASRGGPKARAAPARTGEGPSPTLPDQATFDALRGAGPTIEPGGGGAAGFGTGGFDYLGDFEAGAPGAQAIFTGEGFERAGGGFAELLSGLFESLTRGGGVGQQAAGQFEGFGNLFGGGVGFDPSRFERKPGIMGNIQEAFAPEPFKGMPMRYGQPPSGFNILETLGNFVFPGTENFPQPGSQIGGEDRGASRFLEPGQSVADAFGIEKVPTMPGPPFRNAMTGRESFDPEGRLIANQWDLFWDSLAPDYGTTGPLEPFAGGGGGAGGFGGFNFEPGDPADPRFWLDMVRWLI